MPWIWKEPLNFPSRHSFPHNPGISDRQLWAIGMIVIQWNMLEMLMHDHVRYFTRDDRELAKEYEQQKSFKHQRQFWQKQIETKLKDPKRTQLLALNDRIKVVKAQRDKIIHNLWGGGMQAGTPYSENYTTDAQILGSMHAWGAGKWRLTFQELRKIGRNLATVNYDMFAALFINVDPNSE